MIIIIIIRDSDIARQESARTYGINRSQLDHARQKRKIKL